MRRHSFRAIFAALSLLSSLSWAQGMLLPTSPQLSPLGIKYQRVSATITDGAAVTTVDQVFLNSTNQPLEAHYVFPLPKGAALQSFSLYINGKKTKGEALEKQKAAEIYEGIVRRLQDPGLLEYIDSDVFRARVFPVPANGEQRIELVFSQVLDFASGVYQYHYPLGASSKGAPRLNVKQDFTFSAKVTSKVPLRSVYSPTHALGITRRNDNEAVAGMEMGPGADISRDLDLFLTVSDKDIGFNLLSFRPNAEEPGYFMALLAPKVETSKSDVVAKRVTFVIDTSGSMAGERMKLAKEALKHCLQRLRAQDEFNVVRFSTDVEALFQSPLQAQEGNVKKALDFVNSLDATGGTAIDDALTRGLADGKDKGEKPHLVLFVTDGNPTIGETDEGKISAHAKASNSNQKSRVFTFGVGEDLNAKLLDRLALDGSGVSDFAKDGKAFEVKISSFFDKVSNPVLSDVQIDLNAYGVFDVYPKKIPDLFSGQQLAVLGRYCTPKEAAVTMSGQVNGKKKVFEYRGEMKSNATPYEFLPQLWAVRKVGFLLEEIRLHGETGELKNEVTALGKKFGIVTPYTSYLVVEDTPVAMDSPPRTMPRPRPFPRPFPEPRPGPWPGPSPVVPDIDPSVMNEQRREERELMDSMPKGTARGGSPSDSQAIGGMPGGNMFGGSGRSAAKAPAPMKVTASEGAEGIAASQAVRDMKEKTTAQNSGAARAASGRNFVQLQGVWTEGVPTPGEVVVTVKYLSAAYFALLKAKPELKGALALGPQVSLVIVKGKRLVISETVGETAAEKVPAMIKL